LAAGHRREPGVPALRRPRPDLPGRDREAAANRPFAGGWSVTERPPCWTNEELTILTRARSAKRELESFLDRILASSSLLDPEPLAELGRFLSQEAHPAARAYARLLRSHYRVSSSPQMRGGG